MEPVAANLRTHDSDKNVTITIIEQIRKQHWEIERKNELLRDREKFGQRKLDSTQPNGLNKITGSSL